MAQAWRPSSSAIYGAPERYAAVEIAGQIQGQLDLMGQQQVEAENRREETDAMVAMEKTHQAFKKMMRENQSDPSSWKETYLKDKEKIRASIMGPIKTPGARNAIEPKLDMMLAQWEGWIEEQGAMQSARNADSSFRVADKDFLENTPEYTGQNDLTLRIDQYRELLDRNHNGGNMPVSDLPTPEVVDAKFEMGAKKFIGDYLIQVAQGQPEEEGLAFIDSANAMGESYGLKPGAFGTEDVSELKKRYKGYVKATRIAEDKAETERIKTNDRNMTAWVLRTIRGGEGVAVTLADIENAMLRGDISEETGRILHDKLMQAGRGNTKQDEAKRLRAYGIMGRQTDRLKDGKISYKEWDAIYRAHFSELDEEDAEHFLDLSGTAKRTIKETAVTQARKIADKALAPLFVNEETNDIDELKTDEAVGEVMKQVQETADLYFSDETRYDLNGFRREVNRIVTDYYANFAKGEKGNEPGWLSRWWYGKKKEQVTGGMVRMRAPDGSTGLVSADEVEEAKRRDYKVIE